jgi:hypothetical protein
MIDAGEHVEHSSKQLSIITKLLMVVPQKHETNANVRKHSVFFTDAEGDTKRIGIKDIDSRVFGGRGVECSERHEASLVDRGQTSLSYRLEKGFQYVGRPQAISSR